MARGKKKESTLTPEEKLAQALVPVEEQPYKVPENWCWVYLPNVCDYMRAGGDKPRMFSEEKTAELNIPVVANGIQNEGIIGFTDVENEKAGTVTVSGRGTIGYPILREYPYYPVVRLIVLAPNKAILPSYLKNVFFCLEEEGTGSSIPQLTVPMLKSKPVPVAPLNEQQHIVDRIEYLFAKLDEAKEKAQSVLDSFETRKAAILHKAFTGELTAMWRKKSMPPPAAKYLQQIIDSNSSFSRKEFKFWNNENLPEGWSESKIGNLLYFAGRIGWKGLKAEEYTTEGPMLLSVYNLNDGDEVTYHRVYHISKERYEESPEIMVQKGDVLLTKDGAGIGKLGYVKELPGEATINSSLLLLRPANSAVSKYVYYILLGPSLQRIVKERITGSATPHLFQRDIKEFVIPVPSLEEQTEIVRILDSLFAKEQQAKEAAEAVLEKIDLLKKSILARAFRGELGTNDPTEESAQELLKSVL